MPEPEAILIIGGGIAGIQAALDAANSGAKVVLVEKEPTIGGKMSVLDKNFPTLDCSICIESPKMSEVGLHPNIELLTGAEVQTLEGEAGDFRAVIRQNPRFVTDACTRCGECVPVCPVVKKNEFDVGMAARKAIYIPIEQSVPGAYVIDGESCLNKPPNYLPCSRCTDACGPNAIDFDMKPRLLERRVAAVIVATGFDLLNPELLTEFNYGKHPDILTSMELERLLQASGPSLGEVVRPSDGEHPENVLFVLCAGSRDQRFVRYCSRICCMYSIKESYQLKDHGVKNVDVAYMDIRAYGKGFDEFYDRARDSGVNFTRGRPASVTPAGNRLKVSFEDTQSGQLNKDKEYDMVVLATAVVPSRSTESLAKVLGVEVADDGFFESKDEFGEFVTSTRDGVFLAGCSTGPKDIPDSVLEAGAAVAKALTHLKRRSWPEPLNVIPLSTEGEPRIGVFVCHCGSNIAGVVDVPELVNYARTLPGVVHAQDQTYSCAANTLNDISSVIREKKINRVVVSACSPKTHYPTFQGSLKRAGLNQYLLEMSNIRNMDSWVHKDDREGALEKAKDMTKMAVLKANKMKPLAAMRFPVTQKALVVGGGIAGIVAATNLAEQGFETHLVEKDAVLGGLLNQLGEIAPLGVKSSFLVETLLEKLRSSGAKVHTSTKVENISGFVGNYHARLTDGSDLEVGAVVLATGAEPYSPTEFEYSKDPKVVTSLELEKMVDDVGPGKSVSIISCIGSRDSEFGCSRYCCQTMINQALRLKERGNSVNVLYKDLRAFSRFGEEEYEVACRKGVSFIQYPQDSLPQDAIKMENGDLSLKDELLGEEIVVPSDLVVLNLGLKPVKEENGVVFQMKIPVDQQGFALESHPKLGPAESVVQGVVLAGTCQYPKSVKESAVQALASAAKAATIISKQEIEREPFVAVVDQAKCTKCVRCIPVCPYNAIRGELGKSIEFITAMCQGCGTCVAECAVEGALRQEDFTDEQMMAQIDAALETDAQNKLLVFACNWCSYAGADLAGVMKIQYPSNSRILRTMCSGRVSQKLMLYAFSKGAGAVLVTGCHPGDCHYINANLQTEKRVERWRTILKARGVNPDRLQLWWVSAAEPKRFADKVREMTQLITQLPPEELVSTTSKIRVATRSR
ncbi:MAG: hydrogenase iron-sulfur subunit [Nitrososphaerales archaeon]|nr:hydrogenase iron-sulfur subunit [Nitrososphaerales archaeon]